MRVFQAATVAASVALLAGCQSAHTAGPVFTREGYAAYRESMIGSPAFFRNEVADCVRRIRSDPAKLRDAALLTSLPESRAPNVMCERMNRAKRDGRIGYELYHKEMTTPEVDPETIRIAQGR